MIISQYKDLNSPKKIYYILKETVCVKEIDVPKETVSLLQ